MCKLEKTSIPWKMKQIKSGVEQGNITFDSYVQRNLVWKKEQKSLLIDSILNGFPIPPIYAVRDTKTKVSDCIDGKQRSNAVISFMNDEFALVDVSPYVDDEGNETDINGLKFSELDSEIQNEIKNATFLVYLYDDLTDEQEAELFFRLNNGKPLTAIQKSRVACPAIREVDEIADNSPFIQQILSNKAKERKQDELLVIQSLITLRNEEDMCLDNKYVCKEMESLEITDEEKEALFNAFKNIQTAYAVNMDNKAVLKKLSKNTHISSLVPLASEIDEDNIESFCDFVTEFFDVDATSISGDYNEACKSGSGHHEQVVTRLNAVKKAWDEF